jgi:CBS domain-containing protein
MPATEQIEQVVRQAGQVLWVSSQSKVIEAAQKMRDHDVGCLVVLDRGRVIGILTERDIISKVVARSRSPEATHVEEAMSRQVIVCTLDTPITKAQRIMAEHGIRHLPVVQDGAPIGMISIRDVLDHQFAAVKAIVRQQSKVLRMLEEEYPGITKLEKDRSGRVIL